MSASVFDEFQSISLIHGLSEESAKISAKSGNKSTRVLPGARYCFGGGNDLGDPRRVLRRRGGGAAGPGAAAQRGAGAEAGGGPGRRREGAAR